MREGERLAPRMESNVQRPRWMFRGLGQDAYRNQRMCLLFTLLMSLPKRHIFLWQVSAQVHNKVVDDVRTGRAAGTATRRRARNRGRRCWWRRETAVSRLLC